MLYVCMCVCMCECVASMKNTTKVIMFFSSRIVFCYRSYTVYWYIHCLPSSLFAPAYRFILVFESSAPLHQSYLRSSSLVVHFSSPAVSQAGWGGRGGGGRSK